MAAAAWSAATLAALAPSTSADTTSAAAPYRVGVATVTVNPSSPVYMGGYGGGPAPGTTARYVDPLTGQPEDFTVRAMAIEAGGKLIELERIDSQGYYAGYVEGPYGITDVRKAAAAYLRAHGFPSETKADIIVSTLHQHAAPTIQGLWGPPQQQLPYLQQVAKAAQDALEQAAGRTQPATITWGSLDVPWIDSTNLANANANEGWPNDGSLLALWARNAQTGATIATYVSEPAYPNIVYGPGDLRCPGFQAPQLSTDFIDPTQAYLERHLGGTALVASGTLGDQPGPMQGDSDPTDALPPVSVNGQPCKQTAAFADDVHMSELLGNLTLRALSEGRNPGAASVAGSEKYILSPVYNPLLLAINNGGTFDGGTPWTELGNPEAYPTDRSTSPPYEVGNLMGTWVTGLRLGKLLILSEPGEFFPSIHQAWNKSVSGAAGVFVVGMGQDQLGYDFPAYAYPFTYYSADQNLFNPSLTLGDQVVTAGEQDARKLGFKADLTSTAEQTALNNQYARILQPGIQMMPFSPSGDLDPTTGSFSPVLEAWATPQRYDLSDACSPPVLPSAPNCPLGQHPTIGPVHWSFGDGSSYTGVSGAQNQSAFINHTFCRTGTYPVTVTATDSRGQSDTFTLPVTVHPPLTLRLVQHGSRFLAIPGGGDGNYLRVEVTRTLDAVTGTVVDGTGTTTTVSGTVTDGQLGPTTQTSTPAAGTSLVPGLATGGCSGA